MTATLRCLALAWLALASTASAQSGFTVRWSAHSGDLPEGGCAKYDTEVVGAAPGASLTPSYLEITTDANSTFQYSQGNPRFLLTDVIHVSVGVQVVEGTATLALSDRLSFLEAKIGPDIMVIGRSSFPITTEDGFHRFEIIWDRNRSQVEVRLQTFPFSVKLAPELFAVGAEPWEGIRWGNAESTTARWSTVAHGSGSTPCAPRVAVEERSWGTLKQLFGSD